MHKKHVCFLDDWMIALSKFGALMREFDIAEIRTWENYGGKRVWQFMEGRYNEALLYYIFIYLGPLL